MGPRMTQSKESLERWWKTPDAWGYKINPDDADRKERILKACRKFAPEGGYKKALDIGAGEGWITKDLPADEIWGYEISDTAASRWPEDVRRLKGLDYLERGTFDLVTLCGVLYKQYDWSTMIVIAVAAAAAGAKVVTCNIKSWEKYHFLEDMKLYEEEFPYRQYTERLAIYGF